MDKRAVNMVVVMKEIEIKKNTSGEEDAIIQQIGAVTSTEERWAPRQGTWKKGL